MNIKEAALNLIWKSHEQYKDFEKHYSNVRVTLCSFIIIIAGYVGDKLLNFIDLSSNKNDIFVIAPIFILLINVFLSNWLYDAQMTCIRVANQLELKAQKIITGETKETDDTIPDFTFLDKSDKKEPAKGFQIVNPAFFWHKEIGNMLFLSFYFLSVFFGFIVWATPNIFSFWLLLGLVFLISPVIFLILAPLERQKREKEVTLPIKLTLEAYKNLEQTAMTKKVSVECLALDAINQAIINDRVGP